MESERGRQVYKYFEKGRKRKVKYSSSKSERTLVDRYREAAG